MSSFSKPESCMLRTSSTIQFVCIVLFGWLLVVGCGPSEMVVEIALHPTKANIIYMATNDYIYKTRDGGMHWENMSAGMTHSRVIALAIDPLFPANIIAGTKGDAVYKSYDGGQRWVSQRTGLHQVTISSVVHQVVFSPGSSSHVFAATSLGVFESNDGGKTWGKRMEGMKEVLMVISLAIDPWQPQTLYAGTSGGVYKSVDGAETWKKINSGLVASDVLKSSRSLGVTRIKVDPFNPDNVYTATLQGLYQTRNGGESWVRIGESLPDQMLSELLLDPSQVGVLYVGHREGVSRSEDGGITWETRNTDRKSTRLNSSHTDISRMPSSA